MFQTTAMIKIFLTLKCLGLTLLMVVFIQPINAQLATEWTVMIFMNGDNNLNQDAMTDFREIARVAIPDKVKVIVQFDRIGKDTEGPKWSQTLRFEMRKNIFPLPDYKIKNGDLGEKNMGDGNVLLDFVKWAKSAYPANHYMLIIWDHGQGWRFMTAYELDGSSKHVRMAYNRSATQPAYKSVSLDETDSDELYNREIQDVLTPLLKSQKLDILAFDACLMAMVESGYAFRDIANYMVASEELEPPTGWNYTDWLTKLANKPSMSPDELSNTLVESYKRTYLFTDRTVTLSAVDLNQMTEVSRQIDLLSGLLVAKLQSQIADIKRFRDGCLTYDPDQSGPFFHIDMVQFCDQVIAKSKDQELVTQANNTKRVIKAAVKHNFFGADRKGAFGSNGLAIYFPATGTDYKNDPYETGGYKKDNRLFPVEFVQTNRWADFLQAYFLKVP